MDVYAENDLIMRWIWISFLHIIWSWHGYDMIGLDWILEHSTNSSPRFDRGYSLGRRTSSSSIQVSNGMDRNLTTHPTSESLEVERPNRFIAVHDHNFVWRNEFSQMMSSFTRITRIAADLWFSLCVFFQVVELEFCRHHSLQQNQPRSLSAEVPFSPASPGVLFRQPMGYGPISICVYSDPLLPVSSGFWASVPRNSKMLQPVTATHKQHKSLA